MILSQKEVPFQDQRYNYHHYVSALYGSSDETGLFTRSVKKLITAIYCPLPAAPRRYAFIPGNKGIMHGLTKNGDPSLVKEN